jgi:hypothetical protein
VFWCAYCGREGSYVYDPDGESWHIDHVRALAKGGSDGLWNMVKACKSCNLRKSDRIWNPEFGLTAFEMWTPDLYLDDSDLPLAQKLELLYDGWQRRNRECHVSNGLKSLNEMLYAEFPEFQP